MSGKILKRWLNAPEAVRHAYQQDLARICDLLEPQTPIQLWVLNDEKAQLESQQNIEKAYADLKAELIEQARIRRQLALEKLLQISAQKKQLMLLNYRPTKFVNLVNKRKLCRLYAVI